VANRLCKTDDFLKKKKAARDKKKANGKVAAEKVAA
jgi:hypothetical protein